jgi:hypothetical protein
MHSLRRCALSAQVGDHCQLPPSVRSREAEARGLTLSLFGRLIAHGVPPFFLDTQYRAHPTLMQFPSEVVYLGQLRSGVSAADRPPVGGFEWPRDDCPLAFVEVEARESVENDSKLNQAEAERYAHIGTGPSSPFHRPHHFSGPSPFGFSSRHPKRLATPQRTFPASAHPRWWTRTHSSCRPLV